MRALARLRNLPTSPRKMRMVADLIRGKRVSDALNILKFDKKHSSKPLETLLVSAVSNWQSLNEGSEIEESELFVTEIFVDSARVLKRLRPAPQGRAHRIRKRSNHVTLAIDGISVETVEEEVQNSDNTK